jgi:AraC-like DNA-binding protein
MMVALSTAELQALFEAASQQGERIYQHSACECQELLPQKLGSGGDRTIVLRHGLTIRIRNALLWQTIRLENPHDQSTPLIAKFHLSGNSRVLTPNVPDVKPDYEEIAGYNYLYYLPNLVEFEEWYAQESILLVMVLIEPESLQEFDPGRDLPQPLQRLIAGDLTARFHQPLGQTTTAMRQILHQVLQCPYQGTMQKMYLESKALELLTLQFTHWLEDSQTPQRAPRLRHEDIERLHQAREILIQNIDNPPSLLALARQVRLNECKLKWGFRQIFGTTVFGYLHEVRMERSRQLLATGQLSVTEVAYAVGYSSLPSFSKAFRKRFGSSPLAYNSQFRFG